MLGEILGFIGGERANDAAQDRANAAMNFSAEQIQQQQAFQERMSGSQYQRGTADMEAAGLNPMLAYSQGGASSPAGGAASGVQAPVINSIQAGLNSASTYASIENVKAQTENTKANTKKTENETPTPWNKEGELDGPKTAGNYARDILMNQARAQIQKANLRDEEINLVKQQIQNAIKENKNIVALTGNRNVDIVLKSLDIPKAKNEAEAEKSGFKKHVSPYLNDIGKVSGSAAQIANPANRYQLNRYIIKGK